MGPERARRLIERYGTVEAVLSASAAGLESVPAIGKTRAEAIRWALEETAPPYGTVGKAGDDWPIRNVRPIATAQIAVPALRTCRSRDRGGTAAEPLARAAAAGAPVDSIDPLFAPDATLSCRRQRLVVPPVAIT